MALISASSPEHKQLLAARLQDTPDCDAAIVRIGEADYGCEERRDDAPQKIWVLLLLRDGSVKSTELPEPLLESLKLEEGSLCRLCDLGLA